MARASFFPFPWPAPLARMEPHKRMLSLALGISLLVHAVVLSIHFQLPQRIVHASEDALDIILVNSKSARRPSDAQVKAQNNLDGGGNTPEEQRIQTPLPASVQARDGDAMLNTRQRVAELEARNKALMAQARNSLHVLRETRETAYAKEQGKLSGLDLANSAMAQIRSLEGEIAQSENLKNKHPLRKDLTLRATAAPEAAYVTAVIEKIERVGTMNFPASARGNAYGQLTVTLLIKPDGSLLRAELLRPADTKVLNDAALKIAHLADPYPRVPPAVLNGNEVVAVTRVWTFTNDDFKTRGR